MDFFGVLLVNSFVLSQNKCKMLKDLKDAIENAFRLALFLLLLFSIAGAGLAISSISKSAGSRASAEKVVKEKAQEQLVAATVARGSDNGEHYSKVTGTNRVDGENAKSHGFGGVIVAHKRTEEQKQKASSKSALNTREVDGNGSPLMNVVARDAAAMAKRFMAEMKTVEAKSHKAIPYVKDERSVYSLEEHKNDSESGAAAERNDAQVDTSSDCGVNNEYSMHFDVPIVTPMLC